MGKRGRGGPLTALGTKFRKKLVALGPAGSTALLTAASIAASLTIALLVTGALHRISLMGIAIAVATPALLVPVTWYPFLRISARLDRTEDRLRASEEKYRSILESIGEAYLEIDGVGKIAFFNEALCRISGFARGELQGRAVADLLPPAAIRTLRRAALRRLSRGGGDLAAFGFTSRDGTPRFFEASLAPLGPGGDPGGFRAVIRDVTEREAAARERGEYEERLRRARKMESLGLLAGGVAHDLNNVLSGLVGYPDILLHDYPSDPVLRAGLTTIRESGERAAGIVQDLLALSRRGLPSGAEPLDVNRVVAEHLGSPEHGRLRRDRPEVRLTQALEPGVRTIDGSGLHLAKALSNLVLNAFEAVPGAGEVVVSTGNLRLEATLPAYERVPPGDYVTLAVSDTGKGMTGEDLDRVFEPFYSRKRLGRSGTGLGMAVVWGVVKDHAGYVDIRSSPAGGTTVELFFPASDRPVAAAEPAGAPELLRGRGERVLVADDEPDQRVIAVQMLRRLGYEAGAVPGGLEAVDRLREQGADLVLVDMLMEPGPDGLDTVRMIRQILPELPLVIVSGYAETGRIREAIDLGRVAYLRKPYGMGSLARVVREALHGGSAAARARPAALEG